MLRNKTRFVFQLSVFLRYKNVCSSLAITEKKEYVCVIRVHPFLIWKRLKTYHYILSPDLSGYCNRLVLVQEVKMEIKEVSKIISGLNKQGKVMSPKRCYYAPTEK